MLGLPTVSFSWNIINIAFKIIFIFNFIRNSKYPVAIRVFFAAVNSHTLRRQISAEHTIFFRLAWMAFGRNWWLGGDNGWG